MKRFIEDLIDRLELARKYALLSAENGIYPDYIKMDRAVAKAYVKAIEIVNELVGKYNNGWIPCSERMPELEQECMWTVNMKKYPDAPYEIILGKYRMGLQGDIWKDWCIAWKPLPEPYKEV